MTKVVWSRPGLGNLSCETRTVDGWPYSRMGQTPSLAGNKQRGRRSCAHWPKRMAHVANQRLCGRRAKRKGSALTKLPSSDGQNLLALVQVPNVQGQGLTNPDAGGVKQAEQGRGGC
jgi:hypothetical protein